VEVLFSQGQGGDHRIIQWLHLLETESSQPAEGNTLSVKLTLN